MIQYWKNCIHTSNVANVDMEYVPQDILLKSVKDLESLVFMRIKKHSNFKNQNTFQLTFKK